MDGQRVGFRVGEAFKIRLMPREIMVCVEIAKRVAPAGAALSLAQAIRVGFTELCEAAIKCKAVAEPDPFDYEQSVASYRRASLPRKLQTSQAVMRVQMERVSAGGTAAFGAVTLNPDQGPLTTEDIEASHERTRRALTDDGKSPAQIARIVPRKRVDPRKLRFDELKFRSEQDPANMSAVEFKELRKLQRELSTATQAAVS